MCVLFQLERERVKHTKNDKCKLQLIFTLDSNGFSPLGELWLNSRAAGGWGRGELGTNVVDLRFHATLIDSWRYVAALWINSPGRINSVVQFRILNLSCFPFIRLYSENGAVLRHWVHPLQCLSTRVVDLGHGHRARILGWVLEKTVCSR